MSTLRRVSDPFRILTVCIGNVCRSPFAERVLRMRLDAMLGDRASQVDVSSAGVHALVGRPMDARAAAELVRLGGDPAGFVATQLTPAMVRNADLVLTASVALRSRVLEDSPRALPRTFTIREFAALGAADGSGAREGGPVTQAASRRGSERIAEYDVPDPIGQPRLVHEQVTALLEESSTAIARTIAGWVAGEGAEDRHR
jgi:protein-tyrosine phosphatase